MLESKLDSRLNALFNNVPQLNVPQQPTENQKAFANLFSNPNSKWRTGMFSKINAIIKDDRNSFSDSRVILRAVYKAMRDGCNIDLDKEREDFCERNHAPSTISLIKVVSENEQMRLAFEKSLTNLSGAKNTSFTKSTQTAPKAETPQTIIAPLIEKYNDTTNGGNLTFRKVYAEMGIDWGYRLTRFKNTHKCKSMPKKIDIVKGDSKVQKIFVKTVKQMLVET